MPTYVRAFVREFSGVSAIGGTQDHLLTVRVVYLNNDGVSHEITVDVQYNRTALPTVIHLAIYDAIKDRAIELGYQVQIGPTTIVIPALVSN